MGFVYVLLLSNGNYYVGSTNNLERRIHEHKTGQVRSTSKYGPTTLIYKKEYDSIVTARRIEYIIKKTKRKDYIEKFINGNEWWSLPTK